jgi:hypothetical protein
VQKTRTWRLTGAHSEGGGTIAWSASVPDVERPPIYLLPLSSHGSAWRYSAVLSADLRRGAGAKRIGLTDGRPAIYTACYVSGTWYITAGPLFPD